MQETFVKNVFAHKNKHDLLDSNNSKCLAVHFNIFSNELFSSLNSYQVENVEVIRYHGTDSGKKN